MSTIGDQDVSIRQSDAYKGLMEEIEEMINKFDLKPIIQRIKEKTNILSTKAWVLAKKSNMEGYAEC